MVSEGAEVLGDGRKLGHPKEESVCSQVAITGMAEPIPRRRSPP